MRGEFRRGDKRLRVLDRVVLFALYRHVSEDSQQGVSAERRAARRATWGSDYDEYTNDSSETPSLTWSEIQMDMVQAETVEYMNNPKAGSEYDTIR